MHVRKSVVCQEETVGRNMKLKEILMRRAKSFEKTLMLGKIEGRWSRDDRG